MKVETSDFYKHGCFAPQTFSMLLFWGTHFVGETYAFFFSVLFFLQELLDNVHGSFSFLCSQLPWEGPTNPVGWDSEWQVLKENRIRL